LPFEKDFAHIFFGALETMTERGRKRGREADHVHSIHKKQRLLPTIGIFDQLFVPDEVISLILECVYLTPCHEETLNKRRTHLLNTVNTYGSLMFVCKRWWSVLRGNDVSFVSNLVSIFNNAQIRSPVLTRFVTLKTTINPQQLIKMIRHRRKTHNQKETKKTQENQLLQTYCEAADRNYRLFNGHS